MKEMRDSAKISLLFFFIVSLILINHCKSGSQGAETIQVSGLIEAVETEIRSQVQGEIKEIYVQEGQLIQKGDRLCLVDDEKLSYQLHQVQAALDGARSKLRLFAKGTKKELIVVAKNQRDTAENEMELVRKNQQRMARLFEEGAVSEAQKDEVDLKLKAALERLDSAEENYQLALRGREKEEIEMVKSEIHGLEAQKQLLERQILDTKIASPSSGYLETRHVEAGELVFPGTLLFSLIDLDRTYVKAYVPERYIGKIVLGNSVDIVCDAFPGRVFEGKVDYVAKEAEFAPKNVQTQEERLKLVYMIKSYVKNKEGFLKPGMPVDVSIRFDTQE